MKRKSPVLIRTLLAASSVLMTQHAMAAPLDSDPRPQPQDGAAQVNKIRTPPVAPYEVLPDNKVVFRIRAPQATKAEIDGDWPGGIHGDSHIAMSKDDGGVWSATVGPLPSDIWHYQFIVNGTRTTADFGRHEPKNGLPADQFAIPGALADDFVVQAGPRGGVSIVSVPFMTSEKRFTVYTPPGYYDTAQRYPVVYLTLGGRHDGSRANEDAFVFNLLDNLIKSKRIEPMIAVVLDPDAPGGSSLGDTAFHGGGNQTGPAYIEASQAIVDEVVPFVDKAFRTIPDREHRAIAGFSSPGAQGFMAGARNPDKFASIGTFSGGFPTWPGVGVQIQSKLSYPRYTGPDLNRVPDMNKLGELIPKLDASANMKLVFMSVGSDEPLIQTYELMKTFLKQRGIRYHAIVEHGQIHDGRNIRVSLRDFLPLLFR
ncbi:esterase [Paraburkholderia tropica]|uniref:esterase n=1 Tax=Paraburkholderia tropica TaxID=92647 RepID=UPI0007ECB009|nr:esterase [Paraburkholderia tropica]OBR54706.1 esterase [Paraburkholderia tropica]